jgi:hypothetical protein
MLLQSRPQSLNGRIRNWRRFTARTSYNCQGTRNAQHAHPFGTPDVNENVAWEKG